MRAKLFFTVIIAMILVATPVIALGSDTKRLVFRDAEGNVLLTCADVASARADAITFSGGMTEWVVVIYFTEEGAGIFEQATRDNIGRPIFIYVDGHLVSSPIVTNIISEGVAHITGNFTSQSARELANALSGVTEDTAHHQQEGLIAMIGRLIRMLINGFR